MPKTLYIGSDISTAETKVLFGEYDFVELVDEYLGRDAKQYLAEIIKQRDDAIQELAYLNRCGDYDDRYQDGFDAGLAAAEEAQ